MSKAKGKPLPDEVRGYSQIRLDVDLATGKIEKSTLSNEFCRDWIGGYGFGAKILFDELKSGVDPLSPDNILVYAQGPFPTTILPTSSKYGLFAKSPLTVFLYEKTSPARLTNRKSASFSESSSHSNSKVEKEDGDER